MTIMTEDGIMSVNVGGSMMLHSLYSTAKSQINFSSIKIGTALDFLKSGECTKNKIDKALDQMKIVKAKLSEISPEDAVFDCNNISVKAPWHGNINEDVSSCMELFTTDDGKILIDGLINLLEYASSKGIAVVLP